MATAFRVIVVGLKCIPSNFLVAGRKLFGATAVAADKGVAVREGRFGSGAELLDAPPRMTGPRVTAWLLPRGKLTETRRHVACFYMISQRLVFKRDRELSLADLSSVGHQVNRTDSPVAPSRSSSP